MKLIAALSLALPLIAGAAGAGTVERACLRSDRPASRALCGCIQQAADVTLSRRDQRLAASFFRDPHQAQVVRQSDRGRDEAFWRKYKMFGATAETYCARVTANNPPE